MNWKFILLPILAVLGIVAVGDRVWLAWRDHRAASP